MPSVSTAGRDTAPFLSLKMGVGASSCQARNEAQCDIIGGTSLARDRALHAFQVGGAPSDTFGSLAAMAWESRCCGVGFWGFSGILACALGFNGMKLT